ncbi:MAG: hypothetical protein HFACDABA_00567 [Anaerolineales bacterium]|nr:hypothetical protein [Anaerolineales bacterium]
MGSDKRKITRRNFSYYMRVTDEVTGQTVGHLMDISTGGFKLDSSTPVPPNKDFRLRIDLTSEVANKNFMVFLARSKWCHRDPVDPTSYNVGFQITNMSPSDFEIFSRLFEQYGSNTARKSTTDHLWK